MLLTNYRPIGLLWYDGGGCSDFSWEDSEHIASSWRVDELEALVRKPQQRIIVNDRFRRKDDFDTPERHVKASENGRACESFATIDPQSRSGIP